MEQIRNISFFFSASETLPGITHVTVCVAIVQFTLTPLMIRVLSVLGNLTVEKIFSQLLWEPSPKWCLFFFNYFFNLYWKVVITNTTPLEIIIQIDNSKSILNNQP